MGKEIEIRVDDGRIVIEPASVPRAGWFTTPMDAAQDPDVTVLTPDSDVEDWEW